MEMPRTKTRLCCELFEPEDSASALFALVFKHLLCSINGQVSRSVVVVAALFSLLLARVDCLSSSLSGSLGSSGSNVHTCLVNETSMIAFCSVSLFAPRGRGCWEVVVFCDFLHGGRHDSNVAVGDGSAPGPPSRLLRVHKVRRSRE